jgi:iron complex outermembrane receptor protein
MVANEVNELPNAFRVRKVVAAMCLAGMMSSPIVGAQENNNAQNSEEEEVENIVVTGVFSAKSLEQAPVALSVISGEELEQQIPSSASDILKNVPGVFVNSALGEIRNVVFSRCVSANSLDGASGYYYVSMQENSVPVELMTTTNLTISRALI